MSVHKRREFETSVGNKRSYDCNQKMGLDNFDELSPRKDNSQYVIDACMAGNISIIDEYLSVGHKINDYLNSGWTLLLYAASYAQPDLVEFLLESGANANIHYEGFTALMALSSTAKGSPQQRFQCLQYLIKSKANVEAVSKLKETALMFACKMQELDFVSELLKHTTDINYFDGEQKTALFYAVADNRIEVAKLLIEKGADISWINFRGFTVYDIAITKGYDQLIPLLNKDEKPEEEEIFTDCTISWFNMFPTMAEANENGLDGDVASIIYGMGLDGYKASFCGMSLKTILQLKEEDLSRIGIDISVHRKRFLEDLLRFHKCEWSMNIMKIDHSQPFTAFEAIKLLGNLNRQLTVMSCGINFAKMWFDSLKKTASLTFTNDDQQKYEASIQEMQKIALQIQAMVKRIKNTATLINQENSHLTLPIYIGKKSKLNRKWIALAAATAIAAVYFIGTNRMSN